MKPQYAYILAGALVLVVGGMFAFAYFKNKELQNQEPEPEPVANEETPYDYIARVDAKHFYIDGTHTIAGEIPMPTPCDLLEADAIVRESMPEQATV